MRVQEIGAPDRLQIGRAARLDRRRIEAGHPVAVKVLLEAGLERFQRNARSQYKARRARSVVAAAVRAPNGLLIGTAVLPGNLIAARRCLRSDRRPAAELADHKVG